MEFEKSDQVNNMLLDSIKAKLAVLDFETKKWMKYITFYKYIKIILYKKIRIMDILKNIALSINLWGILKKFLKELFLHRLS